MGVEKLKRNRIHNLRNFQLLSFYAAFFIKDRYMVINLIQADFLKIVNLITKSIKALSL